MTRQQELNEQTSIETFVNSVIRDVRPKGTSVAVTHVLVAAAYAAANITSRTTTGAIDENEARTIFRDAARLMGYGLPKPKAARPAR